MKIQEIVSIFPYNLPANLQNSIFDSRKNKRVDLIIFATLKKYLKEKNALLNTIDIPTKHPPHKYIYFDLPYPFFSNLKIWKLILINRDKNILICNEPPTVVPLDYWKIFHLFFSKIYTWNDDLVDNKKYFKIHLPQYSLGWNTPQKPFKKKKFLVLVNSNKSAFLPFKILSSFGRELYSERIKAIEFFEKRAPDLFSLYGRGWNLPKKYNLTELLLGYKKYTTYKGEVIDKMKLLSNFKYCICFENLTEVNGYITEKIFDCFKAKCIPIYWGASNIEKYVPKKCFIDFRDFNDYEKLLKFLASIDETKYNQYIKNINKLLSDKKFFDTWFEKGFAKFLLKNILEIKKS